MPIAAPSANRSGKPSPTTAHHVLVDMDGRIPLILDGGSCDVGVESTVLDVTSGAPCILRPGGITKDMLESVLGHVDVAGSVLRPLQKGEKALSPGMRYKHYSPDPLPRTQTCFMPHLAGPGFPVLRRSGHCASHSDAGAVLYHESQEFVLPVTPRLPRQLYQSPAYPPECRAAFVR